jgi:hypothetical protein
MPKPFSCLPEVMPERATRVVWVYGLLDPRDETLRYVGKSKDPDRRLSEHVSAPQRGDCHNRELEVWLDDLASFGMRPRMVLLEEVPADAWKTAERWWIAWARARGHVHNIEDGGTPKRFKKKPKPQQRAPGRIDQMGIYRPGGPVKPKKKRRKRR